MSRRRTIGILGGREGNAGSRTLVLAETIGMELARRGYGLVSGGDGGVAAAANRGCRAGGGDTLALLKFNRLRDASDDVTWSIPTSMDLARSNILNWCADGLIAFEGRYGTLAEIALALDTARPLLVLGRPPLLRDVALEVPSCRVVKDPQAEDAASLVEILESLIATEERPPLRPDQPLFSYDPVDADGTGLRRTVPDDTPLLRRALEDPAIATWWALDPTDVAAATLQHPRSLAILDDGRTVGWLDYRADPAPHVDEIHVNIAIADPADRRRSLGTRALRLFGAAVFAEGHHRITAAPSPNNLAAIRCCERAGFHHVGVARAYRRARDGWHDVLLMDLTAQDWRS